jgi:tetratricopeptide (TPR) repeat protein
VTGGEPAGTRSTISGGTQYGPVLQGRDFRDVDIDVTVRAAAPAPVALAQLPAPAAGFTGREEELAVLAGLLNPADAAGAVVVSAVAGLPGVGKTTLAVEAGHAARRAGWYRGGVLFIDLHGYDDQPVQPGQALDALLRALGIPTEHIPPTADERAGLYRSALAQVREPVLVIADNASSEAQVRPLVPGTGPHRVLVTSRHTLAGLGARLVDVTVLDDDAAVALLDAALRAARPSDDRITADRGESQRLAEACGGLPLALQITASILKADPTLTAAELARELAMESERLEHLRYDDGGGSAAPSVAAAFELSYRRLEQVPARVFRLLPVDPGPDVSTVAAANLADLPDLPVSEVRGVLAGLARAHLIEAASGGGGRWRMHDLLRLYAQKLSDDHAPADHREHGRDRLFAYYMNTADAADDHLQTLPAPTVPGVFITRDDALNWLDTERANLVAVVKMAADTGRDEIACRLPIALVRYFNWRRRFDDWLVTTRISLNAARRLGDRRREGVALNNLGAALREMRRFEEAIIACQDAAAIYRETGDRHGEADALNNLGSALHEVRRFDEAITAHLQDLAICKEIGDRHGEADALNNLGPALREVRRFEEAISAHEEAVSIYRETGDRHEEGTALNNLGVAIPKVWPRANEAIATLKRAAAIFRETGDRHGEGSALDNLGAALREAWWLLDDAGTAHKDAASIFRETGDRHAEGRALNNLGLALAKMRRFDEAIATLQRAAAIFQETGDHHEEGSTLNNLSVALANVRRFEEAIVAHQNAADIFRETGDRHAEGSALNRLGVALREVGRFQRAIAAHQNAAGIFRETGDRHAEGSALNNLGQGLVKMRRFNEAVAAFERATALYGEVGDLNAELEARSNAEKARAARQAF